MSNIKSINHRNLCKWSGCVCKQLPQQDYCKSHQKIKDFQSQLNNKTNQYYQRVYNKPFFDFTEVKERLQKQKNIKPVKEKIRQARAFIKEKTGK